MSYIYLALCWICYFVLHSFLANNTVKNAANNLLGNWFKFYRIAYNFIAIVLFAVIYIYQLSMIENRLFDFNIYGLLLALFIMAIAVALMVLTFANYNTNEFLGLEQALQKNVNQPTQTLNTKGLNAVVRHPLYFATIIFFIGYFLFKPTISSVVFVLIGFLYLIIGTKLEEQKLVKQFGNQYIEYKKNVKMLIPFVI